MSAVVNFGGWSGVWDYEDWCNTVVDIQHLPGSGHTPTLVATGLRCKADGEKGGLQISGAGINNVPTRRFHFPILYARNGQGTRSTRSYLRADDVLLDNQGDRWVIQTVSNPGDADEFIVVGAQKTVSA
jgi:hypothetical protein